MKIRCSHRLTLAAWTLWALLSPSPTWANTLQERPPTHLTDQNIRQMTQFTSNLIAQNTPIHKPHSSVREVMSEVQALEAQYFKLLDKGSNPTGLYLTGEYINDLSVDEYKYYRQIEWRLFNDGLLEDLRKEDKHALQAKLELLQLHRDMTDKMLAEELYKLYTYENMVRHIHNKKRLDILEKILHKREQAQTNGFITSSDILELRQAKNSAARKMNFYAERKQSLLPQKLAETLNKIEALQVKSREALQKEAQKNSTTLEIQNIFTERTKYYPAWSDDLAIDLIVGQGRGFAAKDVNTYVGIKVEIPIAHDDRANELVDLRQRIYNAQKKAITHRISQNIDKLSSEFGLFQHKIEAQVEMLKVLLAQKSAAEDEIRDPVQHTRDDPERLLSSLQLKIIDTRFGVMHQRLKEYELILKIMAATGIKDIEEVFESGQKHYQGH